MADYFFMTRKNILRSAVLLLVLTCGALAFLHWRSRDPLILRGEMLGHIPGDASTVLFLDLKSFRGTPFLAQLYDWAPHSAMDEDYKQFVRETGFNYERDLDRVALLTIPRSPNSFFVAIADGRFDRKKIEAYAAHSGKQVMRDGRKIFSLRLGDGTRPSYFTFLSNSRIAWSDDPSQGGLLQQFSHSATPAEWAERFTRLAGTPLFALMHQDDASLNALARQAPGGMRSPQLAALLGKLQWISIGGKPDGTILRVVAEGECNSEAVIRQLNEFLGGVVILAQAGLNEPKTRKQLDPQLHDALMDLLQSADVQKLDRGTSKSIRVVFDVTPKLLETARALPGAAQPAQTPGGARDRKNSGNSN